MVGDDDQSIYRWRGARVEHIHQFQKDFPNAQVVKLEQNYRSTGTILDAANAVIRNNPSRMGKNLWTEGAEGEPIRVYSAFNERDEAEFIVGRLREWSDQGNPRADSAVLYRSNAQSRALEEALINAGLPYRVYGGLRFFERQEIKDALAYLRLTTNRDDDSSFERIVNRPTRGIGARTLESMRSYARANACSMWRAAGAIASDQLGGRAATSVHAFMTLIERMARETDGMSLPDRVDHVIHLSGLIEFFQKEKGERGEARIENLEELVSAARSFEPDPAEEMSEVDAFLAHAALEAGEGQADAWEDCVQLMTMHSAKGLEFPLVFMCGMEDGLFPHQRSITDPVGLEEERRLAFVGITRAMKHLYLTHAKSRTIFGQTQSTIRSRFFDELPEEALEFVEPEDDGFESGSDPFSGRELRSTAAKQASLYPKGTQVRHPQFGLGEVLDVPAMGSITRASVRFHTHGRKTLILQYANLERVGGPSEVDPSFDFDDDIPI